MQATQQKAAIASSAAAINHSRIRELAEIAMRMDGVYKLYFGESNLPTPDFIKDAAKRALDEGYTYYTSNAGLDTLRDALAAQYQRLHGVAIEGRREIVITTSGVQALNVAIRCTVDPGDEAIVLTPAWPNGTSIVQMFNAVPAQIAQPLAGSRYTVDFNALEAAITPRTRMLLYTSPSNPLGWTATVEEQQKILDFARRHGLWLMADEVYERLCFTQPVAPSILKLCTREDAVIVVQSFSKSYCMTGWRVGWVVTRPDLAARITQLNEFVISHAPSFSQRAAETAIADGEPFIASQLAQLRRNQELCRQALASIRGLTIPDPEGAFYLFPSVDGLKDSFDFCKRLLMETKVGLAPGVAFGAGGEGSIRLCYAAEPSILEPALERVAKFLNAGG
jgi:aspartate aminotransferase